MLLKCDRLPAAKNSLHQIHMNTVTNKSIYKYQYDKRDIELVLGSGANTSKNPGYKTLPSVFSLHD